ncbi:MAG: cytochrome c oxidase subunit II [Acidobacteria bacterium]|nr:cytochrome c oxidase subunit II [Acidobacteriota bacterium]
MLTRLPLFPESASTMAGRVDALFFFLLGFSVLLSLLIFILIIGFSIKYRRRASNEIGASIGGSLRLETLWIVIPFLLSMVMFAWGADLYISIRQPPPQALEIFVVAKQWMWKLQHPEGQMEINELHVPLGRDIQLTMTSEDVIHDFFVPAFRVKADVLPGRYTTIWFHATKPGRYHLFCAQYCGTNHAQMGGWVEVMEPAAFEFWLAGGTAEESMAEAGARLFQQFACANCHRPSGQGRGPSLVGLYGSQVRLQEGETVLVDNDYLRESILTPRAKIAAGYEPVMPVFQGLVNEQQVLQLIAYIKSLASPPPVAEQQRSELPSQ